jgi:hypothetical protein
MPTVLNAYGFLLQLNVNKNIDDYLMREILECSVNEIVRQARGEVPCTQSSLVPASRRI